MGIKERAVAWATGEVRRRIKDAVVLHVRHRVKNEVERRTDAWIETRRDLYRDWEEEKHADSKDETGRHIDSNENL